MMTELNSVTNHS